MIIINQSVFHGSATAHPARQPSCTVLCCPCWQRLMATQIQRRWPAACCFVLVLRAAGLDSCASLLRRLLLSVSAL
jgi:hypothetical protein